MLRITFLAALIVLTAGLITGCSRSSSGPTVAGSSVAPASKPAGGDNGGSSSGGSHGFVRPTLVVQRGQYFTWVMPADWKSNESANGVDMTSPDGKLIASSALLVGSMGRSDPWTFVSNMLTQLGARDIQRLSAENMPSLPSGYPGINWSIQGFEITFTDKSGAARHAQCTCGICNAYGGYSALIELFSAPPKDYDRAKTFLPLMAQSVKAIDPSKIAYHSSLLPAQNHPLDNSALMESWKENRLSQDRIAKAQHEATMGCERMVSPSTGRYYNMPLETYDGTVGGYRNPDHPDEILNKTQPGE